MTWVHLGVGEWGGGGDMIYLESSMGWEFMTTFGGCLILEWVQWDDVTYFWLPNANENRAKVSLSTIIHFRLVMHRTSPLKLNREQLLDKRWHFYYNLCWNIQFLFKRQNTNTYVTKDTLTHSLVSRVLRTNSQELLNQHREKTQQKE